MITWIKQLLCNHEYTLIDFGYEYYRTFHAIDKKVCVKCGKRTGGER